MADILTQHNSYPPRAGHATNGTQRHFTPTPFSIPSAKRGALVFSGRTALYAADWSTSLQCPFLTKRKIGHVFLYHEIAIHEPIAMGHTGAG